MTNIYNGPVFNGSADHAQLAWQNGSVAQSQEVAEGLEGPAELVATCLQLLSQVDLSEADRRDADELGSEFAEALVEEQPDTGRLRRLSVRLRGLLSPVAIGVVTGAGEGTAELAKHAVEQLTQLPW